MAENKRGKISQLPYLEEIEGGESLVGAADGKGFQVTIDTLKGYVGSGGSGGGSNVDLTNVKTNIIPANNGKQSLGVNDKRWGMLHVDSIQLGTNVSTTISIGTDFDRVELNAHLLAYSLQGNSSVVMTREDMSQYALSSDIPKDYATDSELTQAITNLKGGASTDYDTLKKIEAKVKANAQAIANKPSGETYTFGEGLKVESGKVSVKINPIPESLGFGSGLYPIDFGENGGITLKIGEGLSVDPNGNLTVIFSGYQTKSDAAAMSSSFQGQIDGLWSRNSFDELLIGHAAADTIASEAVYTDKLDATDVYINGKRAIYTNTNNNSVIGAFDVIELSSFRTNNIISLSNTLTLDFGGSDSYKMILDRANASIYGVGSIALGKNNAPWSSVYATTIYEGGQSLASKYMPHMKILDYVGKDSTNPVSGGAIYNEFQKYVTLTSLNDRLANVASFGQFLNINNGKITIGTDTITPLTEHQTIYPLTLKTSSGDIKYEPNKESSGTGYSFVINKESVGLGNVENKSSATIRGEITSSNVTNALGYTPTSLTENDLINKGFVLSTALDNYLLIGSKASSAAVFGNGNWGNYITAAANTGMVRYGLVTKDNAGSLPSTGNANGVLTLNTHGSDGTYKGAHAQFAFNSSGLFYRYTSGKELNSTDAWDTIATQSWISGRYDGNIASLESRIGGKQDAFNVNDKHFTLSKKSSTDAYPTLEIKLGTYIEVDDEGIAFRATSFEQDYLAQYAKVNGYIASHLIGADANGRLVSTGYATSLLANIQNLTSDAQSQINTLNNRVNGIISGGVVNGAYFFRKSLTSSEKGLVTVSSSVATVNDVNGIVYHDYEKCFLMLSNVGEFLGGRAVTGFKRWDNSDKYNAYTYEGSAIKTCVAREDTLFYNSSVGLQRFVDGALKTIVSVGNLPASFVGAYSTSEIDSKVANINGQLTKASLKSTLGVSDWALATSKPTYTISQIQDVADVAVTGRYDSLSGKPNIPLVNNSLTSTSTTDALSAAKGKELNDKFANYLSFSGGVMKAGSGIYNESDQNGYGAIGFNLDHNALGSQTFPTILRSSMGIKVNIGGKITDLIHSGNIGSQSVAAANKLVTSSGADAVLINSLGNVGIGTANPQAKLHVEGSGKFTDSIDVGGSVTAEWLTLSTDLYVGGNVGIGTTSPESLLHVAGNTIVNGSILVKSQIGGSNDTWRIVEWDNTLYIQAKDKDGGNNGSITLGGLHLAKAASITLDSDDIHLKGSARINQNPILHAGNYEDYTVHKNAFEGALTRLINVENIAGSNKSSLDDAWFDINSINLNTIPALKGQINNLWARNSYDELYATHVMSDTLAVEEMFTDKLTIGNAPIEYVVHEGLKLSTAIYIDGSSVALSNQLPTTTQKNNWNTAYSWGNHASAGYASLKNVDGYTFLSVTGGIESEDGWALRIGTDYFTSVQSAVYADASNASVYLGTPNHRWLSVYALSYDQSSDATLKDVVGDTSLTLSQIANAPAVSFTWKYNGKKDVGTLAQYWKDILPEIVSGEEGNMGMNYAALGVVSSIILARNVETHEQRIERLERENEELRKEILTLKNR